MAKITTDDVRRIAALARITIDESQLDAFTKRFQDVMRYIDILNEPNTENVEPTAQVTGLTQVMRADAVKRYCDKSGLLDCSSLPIERGQIKVKSVF